MVELNEQLNTNFLQVIIPKFEKTNEGVKYEIILTKVNDTNTQTLQKKYSQFESLHLKLSQLGLFKLPKFPETFFFATQTNLESRRNQLQTYIRTLLSRKDTKHSLPLRQFLKLDQFCPEFNLRLPYRVLLQQFQKDKYVTACLFIETKDLYLVSVQKKGQQFQNLELYALNYTHDENDKQIKKQTACLTESEGLNIQQNKRLDLQRLAQIQMPSKIKSIDFHSDTNLVCIGLQTHIVIIELKTQIGVCNRSDNTNISFESLIQQQALGKPVLESTYIQTIQGETSFPQQEEFKEPSIQKQTKLQIVPKTVILQSSQLKSLAIDQEQGLVYSSEVLKSSIKVYCLKKYQKVGQIKYSNCHITRFIIDSTKKRLFAASREGFLLFFDISKSNPQLAYHMKVTLKHSQNNQNKVKQLELDKTRNLLLLRLKNNDILVIQLIGNHAHKSTIIERIRFQTTSSANDSLTAYCWMQHLNCYLEGSLKGYLKIRTLENNGECKLLMDSQTQDKIKVIHYNQIRRLLFVASTDGKLQMWKLPYEWRDSQVDKMEEDFIMSQKIIARVQRQQDDKSQQSQFPIDRILSPNVYENYGWF